jgi:hypothetical protein
MSANLATRKLYRWLMENPAANLFARRVKTEAIRYHPGPRRGEPEARATYAALHLDEMFEEVDFVDVENGLAREMARAAISMVQYEILAKWVLANDRQFDLVDTGEDDEDDDQLPF